MPQGYSRAIHISVIILNLFGLIMILSASMNLSASSNNLVFTVAKEFGFVIASYYLMTQFAKHFKMSFFKKHFFPLLILTTGALIITRFFGEINGAYAWIRLGPVSIQPSEFAKVFTILMLAAFLGDRKASNNRTLKDYIGFPSLVILLFVGIIVVIQKDFGSAVVLLGISFVSYLIPQNKSLSRMQFWFGLAFAGGMVVLVLLNNPAVHEFLHKTPLPTYMIKRFESSANPLIDKTGDSWQIFNGLVAFVQGGLFGKGFGNSVNKYGYIPEAHSDYILAIIVEELGMIGFLIVFIAFAVIIYVLFKIALRVRLESNKMILVGIASYIIIHFIFNVGGVTALIPLTGVPLLLISSGGSSRVAIMIAIGIAQSIISKQSIYEKRLGIKK